MTKSLTRSGNIRIDCDVLHTWMSAAIVVTASPYHAVTDQHGRFAIEQLPVGEYEMETWHEKLGNQEPMDSCLLKARRPLSMSSIA